MHFGDAGRDLWPQAQQSFESAEASYRGGPSDSLAILDALRLLLDVRLELERALALLDTALADVERAARGPIAGSKPWGATEMTQKDLPIPLRIRLRRPPSWRRCSVSGEHYE